MLRRVLRLARMLCALMYRQNGDLANLLKLARKKSGPECPYECGAGGQILFGQCPNRVGNFWKGSSLRILVRSSWKILPRAPSSSDWTEYPTNPKIYQRRLQKSQKIQETLLHVQVANLRRIILLSFLATLVALHFTPVSKWLSEWAEFRTSVASRLASLFQ